MTTLNILVGDDGFAELGFAFDAFLNMFGQMASAANHTGSSPLTMEEGDESNSLVCRNFVPYANEVRVKYVKSVDELISEANDGDYDLVVTDMQYGPYGGDEGGVRVIGELEATQTLALCTALDDPDWLHILRERVAILAAPALEVRYQTKFKLLGRKISQYFMDVNENE